MYVHKSTQPQYMLFKNIVKRQNFKYNITDLIIVKIIYNINNQCSTLYTIFLLCLHYLMNPLCQSGYIFTTFFIIFHHNANATSPFNVYRKFYESFSSWVENKLLISKELNGIDKETNIMAVGRWCKYYGACTTRIGIQIKRT